MIPESVTEIGSYAFANCSLLETASMPEGIDTIGSYAFFLCTALKQAEIPNLETINDCVFAYCQSLTEIEIPDTVKRIESGAFEGCNSLTSVTIPDSVKYISGAFMGCSSLEEIELPDGIIEIGLRTFKYCNSLKRINLPSSLKIIGDEAFEYCNSLESINIPEGVTEIGVWAFADCPALAQVYLPDSLKTINKVAFYNCPVLKNIIIPKNVETIESGAFQKCPSMKSVTILSPNVKIGNYAFGVLVYSYEPYEYEVVKGFTVYGYKSSTAQMYAQNYGFTFREIGSFPDVSRNAWVYEAVKYNFEHGYITGYSNGNYGPGDSLQRQDFIVILARIAKIDLSRYGSCRLSDVSRNSYYEKAVAWAVDEGIINGYQNGKFGVGDAITREQVVTILYRYFCSPEVTGAEETLAPFADAGTISDFAKDAMVWAIQNGIISGKNATTLAPTATASRAEIATIVMRMDKAGMFE